ncbi:MULTISPECIES: hypothetical protein [Achromobacter]|uniref:hypothetical protein n=1 Tax=Achromobacter TaxID=222 RepID=UPI0009E49568|nr:MULTISPECIES: hypothetical protein [Achromobacter]MPS78407.1 hypothetical protein [Achromobacter sp.]
MFRNVWQHWSRFAGRFAFDHGIESGASFSGGLAMRYFLILVGAAVVAYLLARGIAAVLSDRKRTKSEKDAK